MGKKEGYHVRIDRELVPPLMKEAKEEGRSFPKQTNRILREHVAAKKGKK